MRYANDDENNSELFGIDEEKLENFDEEQDLTTMLQLDVAAMEANLKILQLAISILEKSWVWRFKDVKTKLKNIKETYNELNSIIDGPHEEEGDE